MKHKGDILKDAIKKSEYTITQVAEGIGINRSQFSTMLNSTTIKDEIIQKICDFIGISWESHFTEDASENFERKYYELLEKRSHDLERIALLQQDILALQQTNNDLLRKIEG